MEVAGRVSRQTADSPGLNGACISEDGGWHEVPPAALANGENGGFHEFPRIADLPTGRSVAVTIPHA
jgi:hypothetical protein